MTDSGYEKPNHNAQRCEQNTTNKTTRRMGRRTKRNRPDTHDVNNDRSSFGVLLLFRFIFFRGKSAEMTMKGKRKSKKGTGTQALRDIHYITTVNSIGHSVLCMLA